MRKFLIIGLILFFPTSALAVGIRLNWVDTSNNESGFKIERSLGGSTINMTPIGNAPTNATEFIDTGLAENQDYCYRISAYNSAGSSSPTPNVCAKTILNAPLSPTGLTATPVQ